MTKNKLHLYASLACILLTITACKTIDIPLKEANKTIPNNYNNIIVDSTNSAKINWKDYFSDPNLKSLIEIALENNQEFNITLQEIEISKNEIKAKKGEYLPFINVKTGLDVEKISRYTNIGAMEATTDIKPGKEMPDPLFNFGIGAFATWETDIWGKLHNAKKAQVQRYLSSIEGKNFMITNIISEIAESYYELLGLDNELKILKENIQIQNDVLNIIKLLKKSARSNELAVKRFEAQVLKTKNLEYTIQQQIIETENRINFLVGRYPQRIERSNANFENLIPQKIFTGLPSDLLENRPDIKAAEFQLEAAKLDIKAAKAKFYPSISISAGIGYQAFNPGYLLNPKSILYNLAGELLAPILNRNAIKSEYYNANAKQIQAIYNYEQLILKAYIEVINKLTRIKNLDESYKLKSQEVEALKQSIDISNDLFKYARADYMEVLLTQRDVLEAKFELVEIKVNQLKTTVAIYKSLGGGWK